ncbi:uncharacterized protein P174DRAFT_458455 [Aspergillus novofumigatus IBT 16806]|uniref:Uncharacterized protein n=1 Tax=Aspergillus novofumigatus (strain IBT 16806) TaxID=1392255 RepID=A0A2I1CB74_ASPN1|nr:uncharacterized protein P174DRAFT_458455 [Aspergillus novofumigatus IBT 16806]PKX94826.1 hypothetical protein P174DRAFT_458455 [Aspergillus novofumigatus IBT 16806]
MGLSMYLLINIPYAHYAMIYLDNIGRLKSKMGQFSPLKSLKDLWKSLVLRFGYQCPMCRDSLAHSIYGCVEETPSCGLVDRVGLKISNTPKIAKVFIKFIKLRKQVKHPYNRCKPGDPYSKEENLPYQGTLLIDLECLSLLIYIIRKLRRFDKVFRVRRMEEHYERGEVDDNVDEALPIYYSKVNLTSLISSLVKYMGIYTKDYALQQMLGTPVIIVLISPNETPAAFNYMIQEMPHMAHSLLNLPYDRSLSMDGMSIRGPSFHRRSLSHPCDPSQQAPNSS